VCFNISNTGDSGDGDMDTPSEWRLYQDNILIDRQSFQLNGQESLELCFHANGSTMRLEADQNPGHPGYSKPRHTIEMCGPDSIIGTQGMVNSVPQDDADSYRAIYCSEVVNSWDPNDKMATPKGFTDKNYIKDSDRLRYKIRFQNTGTAEAINIKILDTLDATTLNVSTFKMIGSSHDYSYRIYDKGIVEWSFIEINLPDSNANEPESHGYVEFTIEQNAGNQKGTFIENTAAIYFDFNEAVITNTFSNMIWDTTYNIGYAELIDVDNPLQVFPNPNSGEFKVILDDIGNFELELYNSSGQLYRRQTLKGNRASIDISDAPVGVYYVRAIQNDKVYSRRFIKQ